MYTLPDDQVYSVICVVLLLGNLNPGIVSLLIMDEHVTPLKTCKTGQLPKQKRIQIAKNKFNSKTFYNKHCTLTHVTYKLQ